jgi:hypothetical protein
MTLKFEQPALLISAAKEKVGDVIEEYRQCEMHALGMLYN